MPVAYIPREINHSPCVRNAVKLKLTGKADDSAGNAHAGKDIAAAGIAVLADFGDVFFVKYLWYQIAIHDAAGKKAHSRPE